MGGTKAKNVGGQAGALIFSRRLTARTSSGTFLLESAVWRLPGINQKKAFGQRCDLHGHRHGAEGAESLPACRATDGMAKIWSSTSRTAF